MLVSSKYVLSSHHHQQNHKGIKFARVNCYETPGLCGFFDAPKVPAFRFVPWNTTAWHGKQMKYDEGENMIDYLNRQLRKDCHMISHRYIL